VPRVYTAPASEDTDPSEPAINLAPELRVRGAAAEPVAYKIELDVTMIPPEMVLIPDNWIIELSPPVQSRVSVNAPLITPVNLYVVKRRPLPNPNA